MGIKAREVAQREFEKRTEVLISTDAGGEGINLQFASVVVNYDLPWNPMRVEQRIGRVDRIGQQRPVQAFNLVNENSVDDRVLAVLEAKLDTILAEIGIDKRSDVLETTSREIDDLYTTALLDPDRMEKRAEELVSRARETALEGQSIDELLGSVDSSPTSMTGSSRLIADALYAWGKWTDTDAQTVGDMVDHLPVAVPGEPVPKVGGSESGFVTVWDLSVGNSHRVFSVFASDQGLVRPHVARTVMESCSNYEGSVSTVVLSTKEWEELHKLGARFTPQPRSEDQVNAGPILDLRLVIRVEA